MRREASKRHAWDIPPVYFVLATVSMVALHHLLPILHLVGHGFYWGLVAVIGGIVLALIAERLFARAGTGVKPFTPSTAVVIQGPYRFTRNPMYLGMMIVLLGVFLMTGSLSALMIVPAFFWWIHTRFVLPEEAHMERHLGETYLNYKRSVRRWL